MDTKYKLDSNLKFIGNFWLPQKEKQRINGLLYFNQMDGGILKLDESLKDKRNSNYFSFSNYDIILGETNKHELITLSKCREKRISLGVIPETEIKVKTIFIGKHFKTPGEINFHHVNVKYKYFENWINLSGFDIKLNFKNKNYLNCIKTTYELPNEIKYKINDQTTLIISFSFNGPKIFPEFQKEIEIKQSTFLKIYLKQKKSFINYKEYIYRIRNFLTLSLSYNSFPNNIIGKLENKNKTDDQKKKYQNIHILYKVFGFSKIQKKISKTDMLFTFKDVKTDFKEYLNN